MKTTKPSKVIYPTAIEISMRPLGKQSRNYDFSYWEGFSASRKHEAIAERTIAAMQGLMDRAWMRVTIHREDRVGFVGILVLGTLSRGEIGDMLIGEFMGWSSVAEKLTLKRMFESLALGNIGRHA
jgi:hypothetical protein